MAHIVRTASYVHAPSRPRAGRGFVASVLSLLTLQRSRTDLKYLDPRMLDDIGVTEKEAKSEAERPIWDVPSNWRL